MRRGDDTNVGNARAPQQGLAQVVFRVGAGCVGGVLAAGDGDGGGFEGRGVLSLVFSSAWCTAPCPYRSEIGN